MKSIFQHFEDRFGVPIDWKQLDDLVISDANILRPVKGHAFEMLFDEVVNNYLKCKIKGGTGDSDIDRVLILPNNMTFTLQLKTCVKSSIKQNHRFGVQLHKTHGIEKRPTNLYPMQVPCPTCYHEAGVFPDFLIILHPQSGIMIVPKQNIPESRTYPQHFADPAIFDWNSPFLNAWDLLGFPQFKGKSLERRKVPTQQKLPQIANLVHLTDEEIVTMWLQPENFRTIEMNLKGNLREPALANFLTTQNITLLKPQTAYPKFDRITQKGFRIQIKGCSKGLCNVNKQIIGVEVMGSHGKGAIRCYSETDFDYLGLVIDPPYIDRGLGLASNTYHFCLIPSNILPLHHQNSIWNTTDKIYPICKFYIEKDNSGVYLIPFTSYRVSVNYRSQDKIYLNQLPQNFG